MNSERELHFRKLLKLERAAIDELELENERLVDEVIKLHDQLAHAQPLREDSGE